MTAALILTVISALLLGAAFPPVSLSFVSWVSLVPFFWAIDRVSNRAFKDQAQGRSGYALLKRVFLIGWVFGVFFFLATIYWVFYSMNVYGGVPLVLSVLIVLALVSALAIYMALFALAYLSTEGFSPLFRLFLVSSVWVGLEWLRGRLFTGFPWALVGYTQARNVNVIQIADLFGVFGISFLVVAVNFAVYSYIFAVDAGSGRRGREGWAARSFTGVGKRPKVVLIAALVLLTSTLAYGFMKSKVVDIRIAEWKPVRIAIVQGDIEQSVKWNPEHRQETIDVYSSLTRRAAEEGAALVIWPESAMPFFLSYDEESGSMVRRAAKETGAYILTGSPHYVVNRSVGSVVGDGEIIGGTDPFGSEDFFNSAFLIDPDGEFVGRYDKVKLVPFGEYVPLKKALFFVSKLTEGFGEFTPGPGHMPIDMDGVFLGVIICFESIFPDISRSAIMNNASILVILTNDGWFGQTSAAFQHFEMAILRAVENRVYLLRAANRGISGAIDPLGRVLKETGLFTREFFTIDVGSRGANEPLTFFARYGYKFPKIAIIFFALSILIKTRFRR